MVTNPFQTTVFFIQQHLVPEGFSVEESATRTDRDGVDREVDVVVEGEVNNVPVCIAFEITKQGDKPDIVWAEGLIEKHRKLPTSQLVLVSWNGVTKGALKAIEAVPNVSLWAPELLGEDELDSPVLGGTMYVATVKTTFTKVVMELERTPGHVDRVRLVGRDIPVFSQQREETDTVDALVERLRDSGAFTLGLLTELQKKDNPEDFTTFCLGMSWDDPEQSLFEHELGEYHPIHAFELWASVHDYKVRPVDFQAARLDRTPYAFAEVEVEDHDLTLVAVGEGEGTRVYGRALSRAERRAQDRARRKRGRKGGANRKRR